MGNSSYSPSDPHTGLPEERVRQPQTRTWSHHPFALVFSGGGARGLAHAGVLRALEHHGYYPSALVGVSMGAIVAVTYGLNPDWYRALCTMDTRGFPQPYAGRRGTLRERVRAAIALERAVQDMLLGWGVGHRVLPLGQRLLARLSLGRRLEEARLPVAVVATDLRSGERAVLTQGSAAKAAYASAALAGILPPQPWDGMLLADGAYADIAPTDVARELVPERVITVNPELPPGVSPPLRNGLQALVRALEICHTEHAHLRFTEADLVLTPHFPFAIDTLDFAHKRACVAAGAWAVRCRLPELRELLGEPAPRRQPS